ncbi:MAG: alpha/beta fold hydrolase [Roseivirga sp.]|nr:alpha/beta fold hydrolase [Roseivirga sp.]
MQDLYFRELGEGQPLIVLHGLFGSSDNWLTLGKRFAEDFKVYIIDQRNHGQSFHSDEFSYESMAADLQQFIHSKNIERPHVLGHSMGGKTAMTFATTHPEIVDKLIVADIGPQSYPVHHSTILKGLFSIDLQNTKSRREADEQLTGYIPEIGIRQFLLKNLTRSGSSFAWKINLPVIAQQIEQIGKGLNQNTSYDKSALFVRGEKSDYIKDSDVNLIHSIFTNCQLETIAGAGHWLHAEKPQEFYDITINYLKS